MRISHLPVINLVWDNFKAFPKFLDDTNARLIPQGCGGFVANLPSDHVVDAEKRRRLSDVKVTCSEQLRVETGENAYIQTNMKVRKQKNKKVCGKKCPAKNGPKPQRKKKR
jgi:hypothetical protein